MPVQILYPRQPVQAKGRAKEPKHTTTAGIHRPARVQRLTAVQGFESGKLVGMRFQ